MSKNRSKGLPPAMVLLLALLASGLASAQQPAEKPTTSPTTTIVAATEPAQAEVTLASDGDNRYRIGPGDVIDIRILNRPNLSREAVRVEGNGMIRMPLIDTEIVAACQTEGELAKEIAGRYTKFYKNPQVDVFIKEYHSKQVAIIGAVNEQSRFELQRRIRLLELLTFAKGPTEKAGRTINIIHSPPALTCRGGSVSTGEPATSFSSYVLAETLQGNASANPWIEAGDIINVPEADQAYVVGNVGSAITIALNEPVTLSRAIAMAGGVKQDSKKDKVRIVRQEPGSTTSKELIVDLSAIEKKRAPDIALMANDIVDVPTSSGKALLRSLLGAVVPNVANLPTRVIP
ncbi:MAG: polysaccharide biosynthesis/export family protein [Acidobacteriota bacterium]|nr:polysaccharide biosynthesis/export family protein [Acidobacteriota bacterium]